MKTRAKRTSGGTSSDEDLMERVQRGDVRAFELLFDRFRGRLFGFLYRRCADGSVAEDLLQETWLRVVRSRDRFDPQRRFSTWLFQIANNLCRDRGRRLEVERRGQQKMREAMATDFPVSKAAPVDSKLEMAGRLALLSDRLREVVVLRYFHDLSEREIANIAGIPAGTVKSRLHQAIRVMRKQENADAD
jgi:RNA polymerase sigma-70 factor (ECF subfamily)